MFEHLKPSVVLKSRKACSGFGGQELELISVMRKCSCTLTLQALEAQKARMHTANHPLVHTMSYRKNTHIHADTHTHTPPPSTHTPTHNSHPTHTHTRPNACIPVHMARRGNTCTFVLAAASSLPLLLKTLSPPPVSSLSFSSVCLSGSSPSFSRLSSYAHLRPFIAPCVLQDSSGSAHVG